MVAVIMVSGPDITYGLLVIHPPHIVYISSLSFHPMITSTKTQYSMSISFVPIPQIFLYNLLPQRMHYGAHYYLFFSEVVSPNTSPTSGKVYNTNQTISLLSHIPIDRDTRPI